jgi:hypothetical protein
VVAPDVGQRRTPERLLFVVLLKVPIPHHRGCGSARHRVTVASASTKRSRGAALDWARAAW